MTRWPGVSITLGAGLYLSTLLVGCTPAADSQGSAGDEPQGSADSDPNNQDQDALPKGDIKPASVYKPCEPKDRWGQLVVRLTPEYSAVQGSVENGVVPDQIMKAVKQQDGCTFFEPRQLVCDPPCDPTERCNEQSQCIPAPRAQSAGEIELRGMAKALTLSPRPPNQFYAHEGTLPHPVVSSQDRVHLSAAGDQLPSFELHAHGIDRLEGVADKVDIVDNEDLVVQWTAATSPENSRMVLVLNVNKHGDAASKISCVAEDSGKFAIPAALVQALRDKGVSGYPGLTLRRQSVDSTALEAGCVELVVQSESSLEVGIPGLVSCDDDSDCPEGQSCQVDLTCA